MVAGSGVSYVPRWTEVALTLSIVAAGFAVFRLAARYLPVFEQEKQEANTAREGERTPALTTGD